MATVQVTALPAIPSAVGRVALTDGATTVPVGVGAATRARSLPRIVSALAGAGLWQAGAISSHPSQRIARWCTGRESGSTIPTVSTMNGTAPPGAIRRSNRPPASSSRLIAKTQLIPIHSYFRSKDRPMRNWSRIAQNAIVGLSPRQVSTRARHNRAKEPPMASLHSATTTRAPIDSAWKPATMPWSDAYSAREPALPMRLSGDHGGGDRLRTRRNAAITAGCGRRIAGIA
jgi:hypothetical protein